MTTKGKTILLCDDHNLFGQGLKEILTLAGHQVVVVNSSEICIEEISNNNYDVFFCDLNIDTKNGFDLFQDMRSHLTKTNCFLLTAYHESFLEDKAKQMGFRGYLTKEASTDELLEAISLKSSAPFFSVLLPNKMIEPNNPAKDINLKMYRLSKQEREIIKGIVKGQTSKEIGDILCISKNTVDTHRRNIYKKIGVGSVGNLIQFAYENNLCD